MKAPKAATRQKELFGNQIEADQARAALLSRLEAEGAEKLVERLRKCGLKFNLYCVACGHAHEVAQKCCRKWCPSCAPKRANERAGRMRAAIRLMKWPMHITLTVPNIREGCEDRGFLRALLLAFRTLRRSTLWSRCVKGGVYGMEVTNKGNGWHPHIHIIADCRWLAVKTPEPHHTDTTEERTYKFQLAAQELQCAWAKATDLEMHKSIWIRRCDAGAATEVAKYAIKAADLLNTTGSAAAMCNILDSCRLTAPFGSMRGLKLDVADDHKLTCPNGHREWTTTRPVSKRPEQVLRAKRGLSGSWCSDAERRRMDAAIAAEITAEELRSVA